MKSAVSKMSKVIIKIYFFLLFFGLGFPAVAQFRVEVSGVGLTQLPIAVSAFRGEDGAPQKIAAIVQADLERSG
jgi:Tol biopolymer transport system component